jgi:hypothetical protein
MKVLWGTIALLVLCASRIFASPVFDQVQVAVQTRNMAAYLEAVSADPQAQATAHDFVSRFFTFPYTRAVLRRADEDNGKLLVQLFAQTDDEASYQSWLIQTADENGKQVIRDQRVVSSVDGLYRIRLSQQGIRVRNVVLKHLDATFTLQSGTLFLLQTGKEIAGVIFLGSGIFEFSPPDPTERQQLALFSKKDTLQTKIDSFYMRSSAAELKTLFGQTLPQHPDQDSPVKVDPGLISKAAALAQTFNPNAFAVSVPLASDLWYPQVQGADLFCALKTAYGTLLYQRSPSEAEDVALMEQSRNTVISLYRSAQNHSPEVRKEDYTMLSTNLKIFFNPGATYFSTVATLRFQSHVQTQTVVLKLNSALTVTSLKSSKGQLIYFQERQSNNLHVVLNEPLEEGQEMELELRYHGKLEPELARNEAEVVQTNQDTEVILPSTYLYSNQSRWYPQLTSSSFSPVESTVTVPADYTAITNGTLMEVADQGSKKVFHFRCESPIKYFSLLVGTLDAALSYESIVPIKVYYFSIDENTAHEYAKTADRILRIYEQWFGPYPFANLNIVLKPSLEPGGHAPAGMVIINRVYSYFHLHFRKDPLDMPEFPTFFLAHELAHQWWGQSVGWRSYRDQWLSEGFAQFAAAEYVRSQYGDAGWKKIADNFSGWIADKGDAGPLILGTRLGHINKDSQAYTTIVYNKGAYVLNMLKLWLGVDNFHECLKDFYEQYHGKETGIREFQEVAQNYSEWSLTPFFHQWFYRWDTPEVEYKQEIRTGANDPVAVLWFRQKDPDFYTLRIPVEVRSKDGTLFTILAVVDEQTKEISVPLPFVPQNVTIDPQHENLAIYVKQ